MARKVILDVDPGIDDAVALTLALYDPDLEVVAVTAVAGNVPAREATRNVLTVIEQLDPPRWPRLGAANEPEFPRPSDARHLHGVDGLGNAEFDVAELHHTTPSERVIVETVRDQPEEITIVCLGPLTNVARAFQRDPALAPLIGQIVMMGGSVTYGGNVTPAAEFNIHFDPPSARNVFRSPATKTLIPLDVSTQVPFSYDLLQKLPDETTRAGRLLHRILPYYFRAYRRHMGLETILLHDPVALVAAIHPELFETTEMAGDVEISGTISEGATVFDRRPTPQWRNNMEVATSVDAVSVNDYVLRAIKRAGDAT